MFLGTITGKKVMKVKAFQPWFFFSNIIKHGESIGLGFTSTLITVLKTLENNEYCRRFCIQNFYFSEFKPQKWSIFVIPIDAMKCISFKPIWTYNIYAFFEGVNYIERVSLQFYY